MRSYDKEGGRSMAGRYSDLSEYVHTVIFVVDANDPHLMDGTYRKKLQNIRERLYQEGNMDCHPNPRNAVASNSLCILRNLACDLTNDMRAGWHLV